MRILKKTLELLTKSERRSLAFLFVAMVVGMILEAIGIGLIIPVMALLMQDDLAARYPVLAPLMTRLGNPEPEALVGGAMLALAAVFLVKNMFLAALTWHQQRFAYGVQASLSERLFQSYLYQPYAFHLQRNSAQLIRNAITEVGQFVARVMVHGLHLATDGLILLGIAALLLVVEPIGALVVGILVGVATWGFHRATRRHIGRWGEERQHHEGLRIQHVQQGLGGAKEVKLLGQESEFLARYNVHNEATARVCAYQATINQLPRLYLELLAVAGLTALVLAMLYQGREMAALVPTAGLFAAAAFRIMPSVNRVLTAVQNLRYGMPIVDTLHAELELARKSAAPLPAAGRSELKDRLDLKDVSFSYEGATRPALRELSLTIRRGEVVGIIGATGSGKSTLVDVILGLLLPQSGVVSEDGRDIHDDLRCWQNQIGYVPQTIYLTDDTLRRNIAFGVPDGEIDDAAVERAVQLAQMQSVLAESADGLDTMVGEHGVRLSGGQRQRIGIARALYRDPQIIVLDEATSALDTETEANVMDAVLALRGSKTLLIVAHRLSTVQRCDRVIQLEDGVIKTSGTPAEMLPATVY